MRTRWVLSWLAFCLLLPSLAAAAGRPVARKSLPELSFEDSAVVASGMTPGQSVVWFGVEHQIDVDFGGDIYQHYNVLTAAADGTSRLDVGRTLVPGSIWVAVDLASGQYALAAPNSFQLVHPDPSSLSALVAGGGSLPDQVVDHRPVIMGLAVRPGIGAWILGGGDGGPRDLDGVNDGSMILSLDQFDALPGSPAAPAQAAGTDLWFIVDPLKMQISVQQDGGTEL